MYRAFSPASVCRTCLAPGRLQPIFPEEPGATDYSDLIVTYSGIQLSKEDGLPQKVCFACLHLLKSAAYFRKIARQSDEKLRGASQHLEATMPIKTEDSDKHCPTLAEPYEIKSERMKLDDYTDGDNTIHSDSDSSIESRKADYNSEGGGDDEDEKLSSIAKVKRRRKDKEKEKTLLLREMMKDMVKRKNESNESWTNFDSSVLKADPKVINKGDKEWRTKVRAIFRISGASAARRIECRLCGIVLKQSSSMHVHAQKHLGYRVICEACGKGFPNNCALQQHCMNRHGLKKSFSCARCPFTSAVRFELTVHERTHTGERPFVCDTCGSSFFRRRCLIVHTRSHASTRPFKCTNCDKRFISRGDMMSHHNAVHLRRYVFPCPVCGQTYARRTTVYKHVAAQHDARVDRKAVTKILL